MAEPMNVNPPFVKKIILADGTEVTGYGSINGDGFTLFLWLDGGISVVEAAGIFDDSEKTKTIQTYFLNYLTPSEPDIKTYTGYTKLANLRLTNGQVTVQLNKEI